MPTTAMADTDTAMAVTALATAMDTDMERGQLTLMPMPTTAMVDTALAMEATAMAAMVDMDTERGPLMPMPTTAMADTDTAMAVTALATAMDTDMERAVPFKSDSARDRDSLEDATAPVILLIF